MANTNCLDGMRCPKCGSEEPFDIDVTTSVRMYDSGDDGHGDLYWDDESHCACCKCGCAGTVGEFREVNQ